MKDILIKIFSENSDISVMRIMSVLSLIAGIILAAIGKPAEIVNIFIYSAFVGKAAQRYFESKESLPASEAKHQDAPKE